MKIKEVWLIDGVFVMEPGMGGMQIGELADLDLSKYRIVAEYSQMEFDEMMEEFFDEHGHYPDQ